jgi:hypothetical protein
MDNRQRLQNVWSWQQGRTGCKARLKDIKLALSGIEGTMVVGRSRLEHFWET